MTGCQWVGSRWIYRAGWSAPTTNRLFTFLEVLMREPERVFSRSVISERVWGSAFYVTDHVLDVTVSSLRKKLLDAQSSPPSVSIETVRGVGYRLNHKPASEG